MQQLIKVKAENSQLRWIRFQVSNCDDNFHRETLAGEAEHMVWSLQQTMVLQSTSLRYLVLPSLCMCLWVSHLWK